MIDSRRTLTTVDEALSAHRGKRVYYEPLWGNHGDRLIDMGSRLTMERHEFRLVPTAGEAEAIVVNGGGSWVSFGQRALEAHAERFRRHPDVPIVVLPSSFLLDGVDLGAMMGERTAPVTLIARERPSLEQLERAGLPEAVRLGLDHDMALALRDAPFIARLRTRARERHLLIVERRDVESVTGATQRPVGGRALKRFVPRSVRLAIKRHLRQRDAGAVTTPFARNAIGVARARWPGVDALPLFNLDISDEGSVSFRQFLSRTADAAVVVTNRLHVGILAHLLGKTALIAPGSYHKIRGIYEHSLAHDDRVAMLAPNGAIPSEPDGAEPE